MFGSMKSGMNSDGSKYSKHEIPEIEKSKKSVKQIENIVVGAQRGSLENQNNEP